MTPTKHKTPHGFAMNMAQSKLKTIVDSHLGGGQVDAVRGDNAYATEVQRLLDNGQLRAALCQAIDSVALTTGPEMQERSFSAGGRNYRLVARVMWPQGVTRETYRYGKHFAHYNAELYHDRQQNPFVVLENIKTW
jgi:hypothetical protein